MTLCEGCKKEIKPRERIVRVGYGFLSKSGKFYTENGITDYFHYDCEKAFRDVSSKV